MIGRDNSYSGTTPMDNYDRGRLFPIPTSPNDNKDRDLERRGDNNLFPLIIIREIQ